MNKSFKMNYILFFLGNLFIQISYNCSNIIFLGNFLNTFKFIGYLLLSFLCILNLFRLKINSKKLLLLILLFMVSVFVQIKYGNQMFLEIFLYIFSSMVLYFEKVIKFDFITKISILILIVSSYFLNYTDGLYEKAFRIDHYRYSLGFFHPNTLGMFIAILTFEYLYIKRNKLSFSNILLALVINFIILKIAESRTSFFCIILLLLTLMFKKYVEKFLYNNKKHFFIKNQFLIMSIICVLLTIIYSYYNNFSLLIELNNMFSGRLEIQSNYLKLYPINLLGNNIEIFRTLDCGFIKVILNYGLLSFFILVKIFKENFKKGFSKKNTVLILINLIIILYTISESYFIYVPYNIFMIYSFSNINK